MPHARSAETTSAAGSPTPVTPAPAAAGLSAAGSPAASSPASNSPAAGSAPAGEPSGTAIPGTGRADGPTAGAAGDGQNLSAADRGGLTALAAALRSMTSARPIVQVGTGAAPAVSRAPSGRPLAILSLWAALLGMVGLGIGIRGLVMILANHPAAWFEPTFIVFGLAGILLTACGFVTARRQFVSWSCLGAATAILIVSSVLSTAA